MNIGFNAMGKTIPQERKTNAYNELKQIGIDDNDIRMELVNSVVNELEKDNPFGAQQCALKHLDLTATYRLMAVLLSS